MKIATAEEMKAIDRLTIEDYGIAATEMMRPVFDAVWNACGYAKSFNYNEKGEWTEGRR